MNEIIVTETVTTRRLQDAIALGQLRGRPVFAMTATPFPNLRLPTLFAGPGVRLPDIFNQPPILRRAGFDLRHDGNSRIVRGELRRALIPEWKILELWRDGFLMYAVDGFVQPCWGNYAPTNGLRVNPLALSEPIYLFCELSRLVLAEAAEAPNQIEYRIVFERFEQNGNLARLSEGPLDPVWFDSGNPFGSHAGPSPNMERSVIWPYGEVNSGVIAYQMIKEIYNWFGISGDKIPYIGTLANGLLAINPEELRQAGSSK